METASITLRDLRKRKGLTLVQLSRASGVSHGNLSRIERGQEGVSIRRLCAIARGLALQQEEVFTAILETSRLAANDPSMVDSG